MTVSTTSRTTPASATAGSPTVSAVAAAPRRRRRRVHRSLAAKLLILGAIFLVVPVIVYDRLRTADDAQKALLLRSVREQGRIMAQALAPLLADRVNPPLLQLGAALARFGDDLTKVKLLFSPADRPGFYYVASWPPVSAIQLDAERDELQREGVLEHLAATCQGELPIALRYTKPGGDDEIVASVTPLKTPAGCWAVVTSFSASEVPGLTLGQPYWESREVRIAAVIYLAMVLIAFTAFWSVRRGLRRFAERARAIREHRPGRSFSAQNDVPELADVAEEFDRMVEVLAESARDIRRAAEDNAHAFKTPIAVIRQSLEPLKRAVVADNPRGQRALGLIEASLDRLDGLVASARRLDEATADLIDTPRSALDLSRLITRLLRPQAELLAERRLGLDCHIRPGIVVRANAEMVETVVENLLENAISFSPTNATIGVRLDAGGGMAELIVADEGPGVPADQLERIFERYFSQRASIDAGDGATHFGIGLWVARRNLAALGGTIQAENRAPSGLLMRVRLPLAETARLPAAAS
jgi:two-component system, OmpR family, sensor histidine kinase ChvG